jgi:hypothetical protein
MSHDPMLYFVYCSLHTDIIGVLNWFLTYIILYVDQSCAFVSTRKRNGGIPDIYSIPRR